MVDKINPITGQDNLYVQNNQNYSVDLSSFDGSLFDYHEENINPSAGAEDLYAKLAEIQGSNGAILDGWNGLKETIGLGTSVEKCDEAIQKYINGEITFEEANEMIDKFGSKQDSSLNLFSNIATSVVALAAVAAASVATGGVAAIAIGAGAGALTKATFKATDRATNDVEGDALDAKQLIRDGLSGALTGATAVVTAGTGASTAGAAEKAGKSIIKECAKSSAKTGFITGSISSGANYGIDCTFDENKDFNFGEFAQTTATGAVVGTTVGVIVGGTNGLLRDKGLLQDFTKQTEHQVNGVMEIDVDKTRETIANSFCTTEHKIINDRIRSVAHNK